MYVTLTNHVLRPFYTFLQTFASFVIYKRILFGHGIRVIKHSAKSLVIEMAVMLVVT